MKQITITRASRIAALALAIAFSELATSSALAGYKSGLNTFNFGNSYAGAKGSYSVSTENGVGYSKATLSADGTVNFLNRSVKGVEMTAAMQNRNGIKSSNYALKVAGYSVDSGTKSASYTWSKSVNKTLVSCSLPITVGPVPVTISGSVGGGASIGYSVSLSNAGVGLSGTGAAWANGSASAGIGVPLFNAALRSKLELGKTSLTPSITVTPTTMTGKVDLTFNPVQIDFGVALLSYSKVWYERPLATYSAPSKNVRLLTL